MQHEQLSILHVCVCVCVCVRERERVRVRVHHTTLCDIYILSRDIIQLCDIQNYKSLLQKSPIKKRIFCKRDQ